MNIQRAYTLSRACLWHTFLEMPLKKLTEHYGNNNKRWKIMYGILRYQCTG